MNRNQAHIVIDARMINSSTGRYMERLLTHLQRLDTSNRYSIIVPEKDRTYWKPSNPNFSIVIADFKPYSFAEQFAFCRFLQAMNADLVHFTMPQQPILYHQPHVTTFHDLTLLKTYNSDKNWFIYHAKQLVGWFVFFIAAHTSRAIITPSEYTKHELQRFAGIHANKVTVSYEAADKLAAKPVPYTLPSDEYLLYVGQQSDYKNIKRLILAHQELLKTHPKLYLVLAGSRNKSLEMNERWAAKNDCKHVLFTGFVSDGELAWLYKNAACYVFPSLMEGFGLPGLEAMRAGCPVVSSDATCLPEIYGNAARYFNPTDTGDMVSKIGQVLTDQPLRERLIQNGATRAAEFSWERMARQTLEVYKLAID